MKGREVVGKDWLITIAGEESRRKMNQQCS